LPVKLGVEAAGEAGDEPGHDEGAPAEAREPDPDELSPDVVVADAPEREAEGRPADPPHDRERRSEGSQDHVVEGGEELFRLRHGPQDRESRQDDPPVPDVEHALAVVAAKLEDDAGEEQGVDDHAEGERHDGEVNPCHANAERADDRGKGAGREDAGQEVGLEGLHVEDVEEEAPGVRADPEECGMAEREKSGRPVKEVEPQTGNGEHQGVAEQDEGIRRQ
jgi:hypothetical protein